MFRLPYQEGNASSSKNGKAPTTSVQSNANTNPPAARKQKRKQGGGPSPSPRGCNRGDYQKARGSYGGQAMASRDYGYDAGLRGGREREAGAYSERDYWGGDHGDCGGRG